MMYLPLQHAPARSGGRAKCSVVEALVGTRGGILLTTHLLVKLSPSPLLPCQASEPKMITLCRPPSYLTARNHTGLHNACNSNVSFPITIAGVAFLHQSG